MSGPSAEQVQRPEAQEVRGSCYSLAWIRRVLGNLLTKALEKKLTQDCNTAKRTEASTKQTRRFLILFLLLLINHINREVLSALRAVQTQARRFAGRRAGGRKPHCHVLLRPRLRRSVMLRLRRRMMWRVEGQRCRRWLRSRSLRRARQRATCLGRKWDS